MQRTTAPLGVAQDAQSPGVRVGGVTAQRVLPVRYPGAEDEVTKAMTDARKRLTEMMRRSEGFQFYDFSLLMDSALWPAWEDEAMVAELGVGRIGRHEAAGWQWWLAQVTRCATDVVLKCGQGAALARISCAPGGR